jgi:hypothetical protein
MKYTIEGADLNTGADHVVSVDAQNEREAEAKVRKMGLVVASVRPSILQNTGSSSSAPVATPPSALFASDGIQVTRTHVLWNNRRLAIDEIFSVRTERRFFGGIAVYLTDLIQSSYCLKFNNDDGARRFVATLAKIKGNLNIEREQFFWFVWW